MALRPSMSSGPRWRRSGRVEPAPTSAHAWRAQSALGSIRSWRRSKRALAAFTGLALLACFGSMVWLALQLTLPRPAYLVLIGASYRDNLAIAHNVPGWRGLEDLQRLAEGRAETWVGRFTDARYRTPSGSPLVLSLDKKWGQDLAKVDEPTVVVAISAHGGVDEQGPYLLPEGAKPLGNEQDRVRLVQILEWFEALPPSRKKVLILDATRLPFSFELGMLNNDFARKLRALDSKILKIPNFVVLSASGVDQRSWVGHRWDRSAFLHYLAEGLQNSTRAGRVNVGQLFEDVGAKVSRWALDENLALQTPELLPLGRVGIERARRIELPMRKAGTAGPGTEARRDATREIEELWLERTALAPPKEPVQPFDYSPIRWRRYEQLTRRSAELIRLGDLRSVETLNSRRGDLADEIRRGRKVDLTHSRSNTLTMPVVEADTDPSLGSEALLARFQKSWDATVEEQGSSFRDVDEFGRLQLCDLLIRHVADLLEKGEEPTDRTLARAARMARSLHDPVHRLPAELQFLAVLGREFGGPPGRPGDRLLMARALRVRRMAERAALGLDEAGVLPEKTSGTAEVAPWIAGPVERADAARREGEDLLFSSEDRDWSEAGRKFDLAVAGYRDAIAIGARVREAQGVRNRVLAELIPYTRWVAGLRSRLDEPLNVSRREKQALLIWEKADAIARRLERPRIGLLDDLVHESEELRALFDDAKLSFQVYCENLRAAGDGTALEEIADAIAVPWLDPKARTELLRSFESLAGSEPRPAATRADLRPDESFDEVRPEIVFRGRLALKMLGEFDLSAYVDKEKLQGDQQVLALIEEFFKAKGTDEDRDVELRRGLAIAGRQIRSRMKARIGVINAALKLEEPPPEPTWRKLSPEVQRLTREVDDASNLEVDLSSVRSSPHNLFMVQDLLRSQARRAWLDHWYEEKEGESSPYYRSSGIAYLADAEAIDRARSIQKDLIAESRALVERSTGLEIVGPDRAVAVGGERVSLPYRLEAGGAPKDGMAKADRIQGQAVVWVEGHPDVTPPRQIRPIGGKPGEPIEAGDIAMSEAGHAPGDRGDMHDRLTARALFRGRRASKVTQVDRYPEPRLRSVRVPPPASSGIIVGAQGGVVRDRGVGTGAAAIVLDCSRSMDSEPGSPGPSKIREATEALHSVLLELPRGTRVSLWIFGQAGWPVKTIKPELTIRRIQDPVAWDPALLPDLKAKVSREAIEPWNKSPIVQAMRAAAQDLRGQPGFKTLIVLTDGQDNCWKADREDNPLGLDVATYLRKAASFGDIPADVAINIIGFRVDDAERDEMQSQFAVVDESRTPGGYFRADRRSDLIDALNRAFRPRLAFQVFDAAGGPVSDPAPMAFEIGRAGEASLGPVTRLRPGSFQLDLPDDPRSRCDVLLDPGDYLLVGLVPSPTGVRFERLLYSRDFHRSRPAAISPAGGWRLGLIQERKDGQGGLQMMVTLEKSPEDREEVLRQIYPRDVWFEVAPEGGDAGGLALRTTRLAGYPAPAWSLDVPRWPMVPGAATPAPPVLRAWWSPDHDYRSSASVVRGADFRRLEDLAGVRLDVDGAPITIEGVAVEDREVEDGNGGRIKRPCLVVRVSHPHGRPVWARVEGVADSASGSGSEHRFYDEADKYVGLFWPVTEAEAEAALGRLSFVSVPGFKRDAERRGYAIRLDGLRPPEADDPRPQPLDRPSGGRPAVEIDPLPPVPSAATRSRR